MIKTIILLVIVFYTFPCWKINAQSRDTSNIFAGYYIAVYNKSDLSHKKIRRHHKHSYNTAIDSRYRTYFIPIKIGKNNINQENIWKEVTDNKKESDTIFIFPDSTDIKLFKQIGLIDSNISDKKHLLLQEIKSLPYYNTASNKAYLFKCLYVKGTFLQLRIDTIDKNWQDYLLDIYSISTKKKKKLLLVTGIDSLHSIKSDGTSIQARPYIKTGQQKPCTALIVGNWFAGEEGYIRKEALLEQGEPFVSWIRCNDCPQIRFNESNSGSVVYPGPPVSWNDPTNPDDPQAGYGYIANDTTKEETFFYHSDHLGSTSYITDDHANITQYDVYLPYGELLVDEHSSSEDLPYKFNGKQFDEETGLYYYGARYLNPMASIWYGVDPLAEKYPLISGYSYCGGSPIKLIDSDGRKIEIHYTDSKGEEHSVPYPVNMDKDKDVDNEFVKSTIDALNQIYGYEHAKPVLDVLIKSEYSYDIVNETVNPENNMMQFIYSSNSKYINGGGKIKAAELLNKKFSDQWKSLAHELFHGYQRENKTSLTTVNAEVEAYTFQYMFGSSPLGNDSKEGNIYSTAIEKLCYDDDMKANFQKAVSTFKLGSKANSKGIYNDHPIVNTETSLIFKIIANDTKK